MRNIIRRWLGIVDPPAPTPEPEHKRGMFSTHTQRNEPLNMELVSQVAFPIRAVTAGVGQAMDSDCVEVPDANYRFRSCGNIPPNVVGWFLSQSFIGHQMCAVLAQNWLVNRACKIPAEDATRNGWRLDGIDDTSKLDELDKRIGIKKQASEFARFNRVFGVRLAIMLVRTTDPKFYEKPFNIDSIKPGSYLGISQVDPNWCSPEFNDRDVTDPSSASFYEPTYWLIAGKRYHRSHLVVIRYAEVPDLLKPTYQFGGMPLPQLIWERVYAAERSANEGPQLLLTKRMNVFKTDLEEAMADPENFVKKSQMVAENRDNYGIMTIGTDDEYFQHETSLGDFDAVTMTEYQLVAGVAEMPATKLIGTTPKGFNSTGDYEQGVYRETLATIQEHHCGPLLERHYLYACKSLQLEPVELVWNPMDEPTEVEVADTNLKNAQTRQIYQDLGSVSQLETRSVVMKDELLGYEEVEDEDADLEAAIRAAESGEGVRPPVPQGSPDNGGVDNPANSGGQQSGEGSGNVPENPGTNRPNDMDADA